MWWLPAGFRDFLLPHVALHLQVTAHQACTPVIYLWRVYGVWDFLLCFGDLKRVRGLDKEIRFSIVCVFCHLNQSWTWWTRGPFWDLSGCQCIPCSSSEPHPIDVPNCCRSGQSSVSMPMLEWCIEPSVVYIKNWFVTHSPQSRRQNTSETHINLQLITNRDCWNEFCRMLITFKKG